MPAHLVTFPAAYAFAAGPNSSPWLSTRLYRSQSPAIGAATRWSGMPNDSTTACALGPSTPTAARTAAGTALPARGGSTSSPMNQGRSASTTRSAYSRVICCSTSRRSADTPGAAAALMHASSTSRSANACAVPCTRSLCAFIHSSKKPSWATPFITPASALSCRASRTSSSLCSTGSVDSACCRASTSEEEEEGAGGRAAESA
mmetsp:Transcript_3167/g.6937  ORF Transcript_3167/g.6937 Transcript_3167/m.6937 type:complete len:204 (-) Transcript_3167:1606-2217(-)